MTAIESTTRVISDSGNDMGPGQRLREAREAAQLTLAEVASRMRLEPQILELLENDHYEHLHGPTFVRGYLSGYARLLDLPERPILEAYERHDYRPPALVSELGRKAEVRVSDFPVRMVTYVIAGLLVVLVVLWWQSRQLSTPTAERADGAAESIQDASSSSASNGGTADSPAASTAGSQTLEAAVAAVPTVETAAPLETTVETTNEGGEQPQPATQYAQTWAAETAPAQTPNSEGAMAGESPAAAQTDTQTSGPPDAIAAQATDAMATTAPGQATGGVSEQSQSGLVALDNADAAEVIDAATASSLEEQAVQAPRPAPLPGSDRLAIRLARESWVEIYDRGGGRLYYDLAQEGSEVVVEGAGPMRVLLGDIEGAAVAYNGEPFDLTRYQGRSAVRFTVGERPGTRAPAPAAPAEPLTHERQPLAVERKRRVARAGGALITPTPPAKSVQKRTAPAQSNTSPETTLVGERPDS